MIILSVKRFERKDMKFDLKLSYLNIKELDIGEMFVNVCIADK